MRRTVVAVAVRSKGNRADMVGMVRSENIRKRNIFLALALSLVAMTFLFYVDEEGMRWMMWRDSTLLALGFVGAALVFGFLWWRTPRD